MSAFTPSLSRVAIVAPGRLEETLRLTAAAFEHATEAFALLDADGHIILVNPAFVRMTGYSPKEAAGMTLNGLLHRPTNRHNDLFFQRVAGDLAIQGNWEGQAWARRKNGFDFPAFLTLNAVRDDRDQIANYVAAFVDISGQRTYEERLSQLELRDDLTGLANRNLLTERTDQALLQAERYGRSLALLCIDLDRFREVNETHGHAVGDELLKLVAQRLVEAVRSSDSVARIAADEFMVLLPEIDDADHVSLVAGKIAKALEEPFVLGALALRVGTNIGIARYPADGLDMPALARHANDDLYRQKPVRLRSVAPA